MLETGPAMWGIEEQTSEKELKMLRVYSRSLRELRTSMLYTSVWHLGIRTVCIQLTETQGQKAFRQILDSKST